MKPHQIHQTVSPRGRRYHIDGKRVSREAFEQIQFGRRVDCLRTVTKGDFVRHYSIVTVTHDPIQP